MTFGCGKVVQYFWVLLEFRLEAPGSRQSCTRRRPSSGEREEVAQGQVSWQEQNVSLKLEILPLFSPCIRNEGHQETEIHLWIHELSGEYQHVKLSYIEWGGCCLWSRSKILSHSWVQQTLILLATSWMTSLFCFCLIK